MTRRQWNIIIILASLCIGLVGGLEVYDYVRELQLKQNNTYTPSKLYLIDSNRVIIIDNATLKIKDTIYIPMHGHGNNPSLCSFCNKDSTKD